MTNCPPPTDDQLVGFVRRLKAAIFRSRIGEGRALAKLTDNLLLPTGDRRGRKPPKIGPGRTQRRER